MQTYKDFAPTGFDSAGAFLPERQEWILAPVSQTRDSGALDQSNFDNALEALGGESDTVEVHRFGHWGPGWFEIIIVDPSDSKVVGIVEDLQTALENYPVLDDEDFSRREWEEYESGWEDYGRKDFIRQLEKEFDLPSVAVDIIDNAPSEDLREFFESGVRSGEYYIGESSGVSVNLRSFHASKSAVARFILDHK